MVWFWLFVTLPFFRDGRTTVLLSCNIDYNNTVVDNKIFCSHELHNFGLLFHVIRSFALAK